MALMSGMGATFAVTVTVEPGGRGLVRCRQEQHRSGLGGGRLREYSARVVPTTERDDSEPEPAERAEATHGGPGLAQRVDSGCVTATVLASRSVNVPAPVTSDVVSESCPVLPEAEPALKVILNSSTRPPNPFASAIVSVSNPLAAYDVFTAGDTPLPPSP